MRLKIVAVNFTTERDWIFKLENKELGDIFIMNRAFYRNHNLVSPIGKKELDGFDIGTSIVAQVENIDDKNVVVRLW